MEIGDCWMYVGFVRLFMELLKLIGGLLKMKKGKWIL